MSFIHKKLQSEIIDFQGTKTLVLDIEKTKELELNSNALNLDMVAINDFKDKFENYKNIKSFLDNVSQDEINHKIEEIEHFYEVLWNRIRIELIFMTNWYTQELINPHSFAMIVKGNDEFESWYLNNVKYNITNRIKGFYIKLAKFYANKTDIKIYEKDVEERSKMIIEDIEEFYSEEIKDYLNYEWTKAFEYHRDVYSKEQDIRRKTILFE